MNPHVQQVFHDYLGLTNGDQAAAASLTLATVMMERRGEDPSPSASAPQTVKEAATHLRVSTRRIYELCAAGELQAFKIGRSLRIAPEALANYQQKQAITVRRRQTFGGRPNRCL
jgi:excisionase family DNA binding protein